LSCAGCWAQVQAKASKERMDAAAKLFRFIGMSFLKESIIA
jgi:hypothetical protein